MTTEVIIESGMLFIRPDGHCFHIEKSEALKKINRHAKEKEGLVIAEFLLHEIKGNQTIVSIIEAKSSSPRPSSQPNFDDYIAEIKEKLANSLSLFIAIYLNRHNDSASELPHHFQKTELANVKFVLILVIKKSKEDWLAPVKDELRKSLGSILKIWKLSPTSIVVLNEEGARERGLIQ